MGKVEKYLVEAENGDSMAQYLLGQCYLLGTGVEENEEEALKWFKKSASNNNPHGLFAVGDCYFNGIGVKQNIAEGGRYYTLQLEQQLPLILYHMAALYVSDRYGTKNLELAERYSLMASSMGNIDAMFLLGNIYKNSGDIESRDQSIRWIRIAAKRGHMEAQYSLACHILASKDNQSDFPAGVEWMKRAAEQGHAMANYNLGTFYRLAQFGVVRNYSTAFHYYSIADSKGITGATYRLIYLYYHGRGVERSVEKALSKCLKMVRQNASSPEINNTLASLLVECDVSLELAKKHSRKALEYNSIDPDHRDTNGCILLKEGNVDEAIEEFKYCLTIDPKRSIYHQHMGDAYLVKKMYEKCIFHFEEAARWAVYSFERESAENKLKKIKSV